jgi:hypothetical protein
MQYGIAYGATLLELIQRVNDLLAQGWKPQGGVTVVTEDKEYQFIQAVVR